MYNYEGFTSSAINILKEILSEIPSEITRNKLLDLLKSYDMISEDAFNEDIS